MSDTLHRRRSRRLDRLLVRVQAPQGQKPGPRPTRPFPQNVATEKTLYPVCSCDPHAAHMGLALLRDFDCRLSAWARPLGRLCRADHEYLLDYCADHTEACGRKGIGAGEGKSAGARAYSAFIRGSSCMKEPKLLYRLVFTHH